MTFKIDAPLTCLHLRELHHAAQQLAGDLDKTGQHNIRIALFRVLGNAHLERIIDTDISGGLKTNETPFYAKSGEERGIAGYCAAHKSIAFIPDLNHTELGEYWIETGGNSKDAKGMIAAPVLGVGDNKLPPCIAVLTATTTSANYFQAEHQRQIEEFLETAKLSQKIIYDAIATQIQGISTQTKAQEQLFEDYPLTPVTVNLLDEPASQEYVLQSFAELIQVQLEAHQQRAGHQPQRTAIMWGLLHDGKRQIVSLGEIQRYYKEYKNPHQMALNLIVRLNQDFEQHDIDLELVRETIYYLRHRSKTS